MPANIESALFGFSYGFVYQYADAGSDSLAQVAVHFTTSGDAPAVAQPPKHLCLALDVSGSMNAPDKYPLLRGAIPRLIDALSPADYLTIVLFSMEHDVIIAGQSIEVCAPEAEEILRRIDSSSVTFGPRTNLAGALEAAIDEIGHFRQQRPEAIDRIYILTDGELHDPEACYRLTDRLRALEAEVYSYGFGHNFALDTMRRIMSGLPGGSVKPILNTQDAANTFGHIGELAERIVAQDAELRFRFAPAVVPGDAFRYRPGLQYFGQVDPAAKEFRLPLGSLERERIYTFCFEGSVPAVPAGVVATPFGHATLTYRVGSTDARVEKAIALKRTADAWRAGLPNREMEEIFKILDGLRWNDDETQLAALRARRAVYAREGADPERIALIDSSIAKLERGRGLSAVEMGAVKADNRTQTHETPSRRRGDGQQPLPPPPPPPPSLTVEEAGKLLLRSYLDAGGWPTPPSWAAYPLAAAEPLDTVFAEALLRAIARVETAGGPRKRLAWLHWAAEMSHRQGADQVEILLYGPQLKVFQKLREGQDPFAPLKLPPWVPVQFDASLD